MRHETKLLCPECGDANTHVMKAWALRGESTEEPPPVNGELYGIPVGGTTSERRGCLVIEVHGECGHVFEIHFQQHKGETFVTSETAEGRVSEWLER